MQEEVRKHHITWLGLQMFKPMKYICFHQLSAPTQTREGRERAWFDRTVRIHERNRSRICGGRAVELTANTASAEFPRHVQTETAIAGPKLNNPQARFAAQ